MDILIVVLQGLVLIAVVVISFLLKSHLPKYFEEKGKNLATKEDIEEITKKIETVRAAVSWEQSIQSAKYKLKHDACLETLSLIDAIFSHQLSDPQGSHIPKQYQSTEKAREIHSKLILACEDTELLIKFSEIVFGPKPGEMPNKPPTDLLNEYRNLIRKELGFGDELPLDRERAWFGKLCCENEVVQPAATAVSADAPPLAP